MKVLVTGASGFVGTALTRRLLAEPGYSVLGATRHAGLATDAVPVRSPDLSGNADWRESLTGVDVVIHTAARVHVMNDTSTDPLAEYRRVNVEGTRALAMQAAQAKVRRLVFVSSIKVNGESTTFDVPFRPHDTPQPEDPYGLSKLEAEQALWRVAKETGLQVVVVRPPLVYGPGVKGNFQLLMRAVQRGLPMPLRSIQNRRSMIALDNLADLLCACVQHPDAAGRTFLAADAEDVSTPELVRQIGDATGRPAWLLPFPPAALVMLAALAGRKSTAQRLCENLRVDASESTKILQWQPRTSMKQVLMQMASRQQEGAP